ncbi:MAG: nuclear transport factor 2 family protein [Anaerolineales bacterium]|nr:nuclear transport factor 2 family protein [Anaerolineales bacterium]
MSETAVTLTLINQFNTAFNQHDIEAVMSLMTEDCIFENTHPRPDGARHNGRWAVRQAFEAFFQSSPQAEFKVEEMFATGNRCIVRWVYYWAREKDQHAHVRGVDIFRVQNGQVAEKLSYVKG